MDQNLINALDELKGEKPSFDAVRAVTAHCAALTAMHELKGYTPDLVDIYDSNRNNWVTVVYRFDGYTFSFECDSEFDFYLWWYDKEAKKSNSCWVDYDGAVENTITWDAVKDLFDKLVGDHKDASC